MMLGVVLIAYGLGGIGFALLIGSTVGRVVEENLRVAQEIHETHMRVLRQFVPQPRPQLRVIEGGKK